MTRLRARVERALTWHLSHGLFGRICRASVAFQPYIYGDPDRVRMADTAVINDAFLNTSSGTITIGEYAMISHGAQLVTGTHDVSKTGLERQTTWARGGRDIVICDGAWVASCAIVLGPCTIGENAVVAAGAVVRGDVPAGTVVAGIPATVVARATPP